MSSILKNIAFAGGVLILTAAIFFLVTEDEQLKEDVLNRSLKLLGEQLLAMVPNESGSDRIAERWQDFSEKAMRGEVPPEKVREVAVSIMNASNARETWTADDARVILNLAMLDAEGAAAEESINEIRIFDESGTLPPFPPQLQIGPEKSAVVAVKPPPSVLSVRFHKLGEELEAVVEFNRQLRETLPPDPDKRKEFLSTFKYHFDDGIRVTADVEMMKKFENEFAVSLPPKLDELEKRKIIEFKHHYAVELSKLHERKKARVDSLRNLLESPNIDTAELTEQQKSQVLKKLELIEKLQAIDTETVDKAIEKSLRELETALESLRLEQN